MLLAFRTSCTPDLVALVAFSTLKKYIYIYTYIYRRLNCYTCILVFELRTLFLSRSSEHLSSAVYRTLSLFIFPSIPLFLMCADRAEMRISFVSYSEPAQAIHATGKIEIRSLQRSIFFFFLLVLQLNEINVFKLASLFVLYFILINYYFINSWEMCYV